jgi:hypothetical protein
VPAFQGSPTAKDAAQIVEQELQHARHKAVTSNRPVRVRFNCPSPGHYRTVELIGRVAAPASADDEDARCSEAAFPYPAADSNPQTLPNHDGPARALPEGASFGHTQTLEFWPDGTVHAATADASPWPLVPVTGAMITVRSGDDVQVITVNGVGRIRLQ